MIKPAKQLEHVTQQPTWKFQQQHLPLLISGIAGVAGYNAFHHFRNRFGKNVIGQRTVRNWPLSGDGIIGCDIDGSDQFKQLLEKHNVRTILNTGGSCALKACERDPVMATRVNVQRVQNLLNAIKQTDIKLIHLSIDLVYSGVGDGAYVETDPTDPVTIYGKTMVAAEDIVLEQRPESCVMRISLPMGISFNGHAGAIDWIQNRFAKNKPATLYYDEVRTPTYMECLNEVMEEVVVRDLSGLYHAGGKLELSLYQIAQIVNRVGGYDPALLHGCPRIDAGPMPPRAGNVTMDSSKLSQALGRDPFINWPRCESHLPVSRRWHFDRDASATVGSIDLIRSHLYQRPDVYRNTVQ